MSPTFQPLMRRPWEIDQPVICSAAACRSCGAVNTTEALLPSTAFASIWTMPTPLTVVVPSSVPPDSTSSWPPLVISVPPRSVPPEIDDQPTAG